MCRACRCECSPHSTPSQVLLTSDVLAVTRRADAGTGLMHEEFHVDDPYDYTRPWFGWANALFAELCLLQAGLPVRGDNP